MSYHKYGPKLSKGLLTVTKKLEATLWAHIRVEYQIILCPRMGLSAQRDTVRTPLPYLILLHLKRASVTIPTAFRLIMTALW
jgi:hypothetical protein